MFYLFLLATVVNASWCSSLCIEATHICNAICDTKYVQELESKTVWFEQEIKRWQYQATLPSTEIPNLQATVDTLQLQLTDCYSQLDKIEECKGGGEEVEEEVEVVEEMQTVRLLPLIIWTIIVIYCS